MVATLAFPSDTAADLTQGLFAFGDRTRLARLFGTSSRCITAFASMCSLFNCMFLVDRAILERNLSHCIRTLLDGLDYSK